MLKIISIHVRNHPGVLSHIAGLFTRRAYNIESIAAGATSDPNITGITIVVSGEEFILNQVTKQIRKLIDVVKVEDLCYSASLTRELVLLTIYATAAQRQEVINLANTFGATVADIAEETMTLEFMGNNLKIDTILKAMEGFTTKQIARTGVVALPLESQLEQNKQHL